METIPEDLQCSVCMEVYGTFNQPVCLPRCGHSYCHVCLLDIAKHYGDVFPCPSCRVMHRGVAVNNLKVNYALLNVAQLFSGSSTIINQGSSPQAQSDVAQLTEGITEIQEGPSPIATQPEQRDQTIFELEWRQVNVDQELRRMILNLQLSEENISRPLTPQSSRTEVGVIDQVSTVNHGRIKKKLKKALLKGISYAACVID